MVVRPAQHASLERTPTPSATTLWVRCLRFMRGLGVALSIACFWAGAALLSCLVVPYLTFAEREPLQRRRRLQLLVARSWRAFHWWLDRSTLYRYRYEGVEPPEGPVVFVANHPSLLDVTAILCRLPHVCCVVKEGLIRNPLVGPLLRGVGHVGAGDGGFGSGYGVLSQLQLRLSQGFPVLVFPEGTRSPPEGMWRFRGGAFEVARMAHVPVVPLMLRCSPPALGKGTSVWNHPRTCPTLTVNIDPAVHVGEEAPSAVCRRVQASFRRRLGIAPPSGESDS
jgi:1-acyl-sn-glycerol-3-phosphate acyltransferase